MASPFSSSCRWWWRSCSSSFSAGSACCERRRPRHRPAPARRAYRRAPGDGRHDGAVGDARDADRLGDAARTHGAATVQRRGARPPAGRGRGALVGCRDHPVRRGEPLATEAHAVPTTPAALPPAALRLTPAIDEPSTLVSGDLVSLAADAFRELRRDAVALIVLRPGPDVAEPDEEAHGSFLLDRSRW